MSPRYPYSASQADTASHIINARVSVLQTKMVGQVVPSDAELENIFQSALAVADHGQLNPARFVVIKGDKIAAYIDKMYEVKTAANPNFALSQAEYAKNFAGVGMFIVAFAAIQPGKIQPYEQEWSVAASIQNMLNLFYAYGFAAKWNSMHKGKEAEFKSFLQLDNEWVPMGYLMVGKSADTAKAKARATYKDHFINF
ncbi:MAG: nitroreductase family protein [Rhizobiales bacterium]|nr:nitroreductase family protein [Hyphomicrobiales bacterium]NRB13050.1 nitroreductase family protein [Hyphomicrobiales bacterium]